MYLGAIAAYSSIRFFTANPDDRMFSGDLANAHQWLIAAFVTSSLLHFYYDGFIWKVSERKTRENLVDDAAALRRARAIRAGALHAGEVGDARGDRGGAGRRPSGGIRGRSAISGKPRSGARSPR